MLPYIAIYSLLFLSVVTERFRSIQANHKQFIMMFLAGIIILFRGLRWETGTDWEQFLDVFYTIDFDSIFGFKRTHNTTLEPGYALLNYICFYFTGSYTSLLFIYNAIIIYIYYSVSWRYSSKNPICIFAMLIIFTEVFPLRHSLAAAIIIYSIRYIFSKDILKYIFFIILATSIHYSAIIMFPFYYILDRNILYKKYSIIWLILGYFCCVIISISPLLNTALELVAVIVSSVTGVENTLIIRIMGYILDERGLELTIKSLIFSTTRTFIFIFIFYLCRKAVNDYKTYNLFFNCFIVFTYIFTLFKYQMHTLVRFTTYFDFGMPLLCALIIKVLPSNKRKLFYCYIIAVFVYLRYNTFFIDQPDLYIPYKSIFSSF
jgi:hypothetical protein